MRFYFIFYFKDEVVSKAEGPSNEEVERLERLKNEFLSRRVGTPSNGRNSSTYPLGSLSSNSGIGRGATYSRLGLSPRNSRERRRSAGDEQSLLAHQLNMFVRTRTDSGKQLSDLVSIYCFLTKRLHIFMRMSYK